MIYSQRLGDIQDKSFQLALDRFGLGGFVSAVAIPHGLFGQNVFLTSTKGQYVFRGNPLYPGQFETERFMAEHLHKETKTPVPWPYLVDESDDVFGWPYAIMPRLPGLQLASPEVKAKLSGSDRLEIAEVMGMNLAAMHKFWQPYPGTYNPETGSVLRLSGTYRPPWEKRDHTDTGASIDANASSEEVFYRWISSRINFFLNNALESSDQATGRVTTPGDADWIAGILDDSKAALLDPFQPCFVMNDYKEENTVAERIDGRWQVTGVFDLMEAYFGDGEADLSRSLAAYEIADKGSDERAYAFLGAYFRTREDQVARPGFTERFTVYMIMDRMLIWAYGRKEGWFDGVADFRSYCEPHLLLNTEKLPAVLQASGA